jgi:co-chaperonin GroES (HSP10)
MIDQKALAIDIANKLLYIPTDDRILVKPLKPIMVTKEFPIVPKEQPKDLEEGIPEATKFEKRKVEANIQKGVIIQLGSDYVEMLRNEKTLPFDVGDIVCYPRNAGIPFELFKDSRMLRRYELLAKVDENR